MCVCVRWFYVLLLLLDGGMMKRNGDQVCIVLDTTHKASCVRLIMTQSDSCNMLPSMMVHGSQTIIKIRQT